MVNKLRQLHGTVITAAIHNTMVAADESKLEGPTYTILLPGPVFDSEVCALCEHGYQGPDKDCNEQRFEETKPCRLLVRWWRGAAVSPIVCRPRRG
jgi:hypothetical protein